MVSNRKSVAAERTDLPIIFLTGQRDIMTLVVSGLLNKQVAGEISITESTVNAHRGQMMHKMQANSVADLVKMTARLHRSAATNQSMNSG
jgi:FixJ family two-component response regulator